MLEQSPLVNKLYLLEKFEGKGGWTFARIPEILQNKNSPFGWVRVWGTIDDFKIKGYNLQPMGNGNLFLPVKAEIRKKISKKAGDFVRIILYRDITTVEIPEELVLCLSDDPNAYEKFKQLAEAEQKIFIDWIYSAKKVETKVRRITTTINKVLRGQKLRFKPDG